MNGDEKIEIARWMTEDEIRGELAGGSQWTKRSRAVKVVKGAVRH